MPRRSRGCQACRKRRIGCDGALPSCRQCVITNRRCSGPVQGQIFVDQTRSVTSRYGHNSIFSEIRTYPVVRQPSPTSILSLGLVSNFISFATSVVDTPTRVAWLLRLGELSQHERGSALDISMQAIATACYGFQSKNQAAVIQSLSLYGEAMGRHRRELSEHSEDPGPDIMYASVILSLFEVVNSTNSTAYATHLTAAWKMIDSTCWKFNQNELLSQVAVHVQYQTVRAPMGQNEFALLTQLLVIHAFNVTT